MQRQRLSVKGYADYRGVYLNTIQTAIARGRITEKSYILNEKGHKLIDPVIADQEFEANTDHSKRQTRVSKKGHVQHFHAKARPTATVVEPQEEVVQSPSPDAVSDAELSPNKKITLNEARTFKEVYHAKLAKLEYDEKSQKVIKVDKVKTDAFKLARLVRDSILNIPDRVAHLLASEKDPAKIHLLLTNELTSALEELSIKQI